MSTAEILSRVEIYLDMRALRHTRDGDTIDVTFSTDTDRILHVVYDASDDQLVCHGFDNRYVPVDRLAAAVAVTATWNSRQLMPKAYVRGLDSLPPRDPHDLELRLDCLVPGAAELDFDDFAALADTFSARVVSFFEALDPHGL